MNDIKKYIVPCMPLLFMLLPFLFFTLYALYWLSTGVTVIVNDYNDGLLWAICLFLSMSIAYCVLILLIVGTLFWIHFSCRLIKTTKNGLVVGWIRKQKYNWENITSFGLSYLYPTKTIPHGKMHIYIASGSFNKHEIAQGGISGVWNLCMLKKYPLILRVLNWFRDRLGLMKITVSEAPDDIFWLPYSDSVYQFLSGKISDAGKQKQWKRSFKYSCRGKTIVEELTLGKFISGLNDGMEYFFSCKDHSIDVAFHYEDGIKIYEINIDGYGNSPSYYTFQSVDELLKCPILDSKNIMELWCDLET